VRNRSDSPLGLEAADSFLHRGAGLVEAAHGCEHLASRNESPPLLEGAVGGLDQLEGLGAQAVGYRELAPVCVHDGADLPPADLGDDVVGGGGRLADPRELLCLLVAPLAGERLCKLGRDR
jgi:hypothetical protein